MTQPPNARIKNLLGCKFDRLTVVSFDQLQNQQARWICQCVCGVQKSVFGFSLTNGSIRSCGCLQKELVSARSVKHGKHKTRTYFIWDAMKQRCENVNCKCYPRYGGRGIKVCREWSESFEAFYRDMGEKPEGMTLDRIDNDSGYYPENCRWSSREQQSNNRACSVKYSVEGEMLTLPQIARQLGTSTSTIAGRLKRGWSEEEAFSTPVNHNLGRKMGVPNGQF